MSDVFTNLFDQFIPVWAVEKEQYILLVGPKQLCSQNASWKKKYDKCSVKELVDPESEIGETIW